MKTKLLLMIYKSLQDTRATGSSRFASCLAPFQKVKTANKNTSLAHFVPVPTPDLLVVSGAPDPPPRGHAET